MKPILLVAAAVLAGCASPLPLPNDAGRMTPEQLRAVASDRNANVACTTFDAVLYGKATAVFLVLDRGVISSGSVVVTADCQIAITGGP